MSNVRDKHAASRARERADEIIRTVDAASLRHSTVQQYDFIVRMLAENRKTRQRMRDILAKHEDKVIRRMLTEQDGFVRALEHVLTILEKHPAVEESRLSAQVREAMG